MKTLEACLDEALHSFGLNFLAKYQEIDFDRHFYFACHFYSLTGKSPLAL